MRIPVPSRREFFVSARLKAAAATGAALLTATALPADARARTATEGSVTAAELLAEVRTCARISNGFYRTDPGAAANVPVCGTKQAVFWKADMDIDCDGQRTTRCNRRTDPNFVSETSYQQSDGQHLNAEELPFVVIPGAGSLWKPGSYGIGGGSVVAVVHRDTVQYAVVGDTGPAGIIGEASYATASALGIDPDPRTGGAQSGVTYILFRDSKASPIESHRAAVTLGDALAREFVGRPQQARGGG
ncbi:glycoside hydrolase family 75 protein [Streptomyces sp. NPDC057445]|uniref:glycoside hydrolase family 75 protein n=1 Tax=Streptomyces sp. NPDC057445 TaxID=3346136 RepID=UPI00367F074A